MIACRATKKWIVMLKYVYHRKFSSAENTLSVLFSRCIRKRFPMIKIIFHGNRLKPIHFNEILFYR